MNSEFEKISNLTTKAFVKSIELDVIIAILILNWNIRKGCLRWREDPQLLKHSLVGKPEEITQKVRKLMQE